MIGSVLNHLRKHAARGILLLVPLLITLWVLGIFLAVVNSRITPLVLLLFRHLGAPADNSWAGRWIASLTGIVLTGVLIYGLGLVAGNLVGRRLVAAVEIAILKIPFVKSIYGSARQLLDAFGVSGKRAFSRVVMVEYPRAGVWTVGFVTAENPHAFEYRGRRQRLIAVFLPTTPNPTSGWLALVDEQEVVEVDLSIEEAVKMIVSGGIVAPSGLQNRLGAGASPTAAP